MCGRTASMIMLRNVLDIESIFTSLCLTSDYSTFSCTVCAENGVFFDTFKRSHSFRDVKSPIISIKKGCKEKALQTTNMDFHFNVLEESRERLSAFNFEDQTV